MKQATLGPRCAGVTGTTLGVLLLALTGCAHPTGAAASAGDTGSLSTDSGSGSNGSGVNGGGNAGSAGTNGGSGSGSGATGGTTGEMIITSTSGGGDASVEGGTVTKMSCGDSAYNDPWYRPYQQDQNVVSRAQSTVNAMSLSEKADQMRGTDPGGGQNYTDIFRTPDNTNRGIKGFQFRDGPRGVNLAAPADVNQNYSTAFPVAAARGAAFDMDLEYRIGEAMGDEMVAAGQTLILAPTTNVLRHPAWGRSQETYGEDSYLLGRLGTAYVVGVQEYVPACAKHYAANNIENGRANQNAVMDEQTLHEVYARHFGMMIQDGGVACIMASYNLVNGTHSTQNAHLLNDILRTDFGFKGFILSDWWAMPGGQSTNLNTGTYQSQAAQAIQAGLDMELPWSLNFATIETVAGSGGTVDPKLITQSAERILEQKYRFNVDKLSGPIGLKPATTTVSGGAIQNNDAHIQLAHEAAVKSMVLLKNDNDTLPIKSDVKTVAVVGATVSYSSTYLKTGTINFATDVRTGDLGSSRVFPDPAKSTGPAAGIKKMAPAGVNVVTGSSAADAQNADFVVVVAGLTPVDEGEEYTGAGDRTTFALDGKQNTGVQNGLITAVAALGKPMVVVLEGGSVIDMPWLANVPAVVMAWYPGQDGGAALGELLFGKANFSGKLPITWPKSWNDEPTFSSGTATTMDYFLGYRYFDSKGITPLFPFGYGLSYTKFEYSNLQIPCSDVTENGVVNVQVDIANTGSVAGDEVAFLFVSYPTGPTGNPRRSVKELKGFYRVSLDAGQAKRITIPLRISDLKYWDTSSNSWKIQPGPVQIMVGPSSDNLPLKDTLMVN